MIKQLFVLIVRMGVLALLSASWASPSNAQTSDYEDAVSKWTSYKDVGEWLNENFKFDKKRQKVIQKQLSHKGPAGLLIRNPASTFDNPRGFCGDSANFAIDALRKIDPEYNAKWVFIKNGAGKPNHWVAGFTLKGKLYIMDYGAGSHWSQMKGTHGPYDSLGEYANFLSSLTINGFSVAEVKWREMPGQED